MNGYKTAAQHRDTALHLLEFKVQVEGVMVLCAVRENPNVVPDPTSPVGVRVVATRIPEGMVRFDSLTDEENKLIRDACILLEKKRHEQVIAYQTSPERQAKKVSEALEAENKLRETHERHAHVKKAIEEAHAQLSAAKSSHAETTRQLDLEIEAKKKEIEAYKTVIAGLKGMVEPADASKDEAPKNEETAPKS